MHPLQSYCNVIHTDQITKEIKKHIQMMMTQTEHKL